MVDKQLVARGISDERVLAAMREIPRHRFVPSEKLGLTYGDRPVPIGSGQTISQPSLVAMMTAAQSLGIYDELAAELSSSQSENLSRMEGNVPRLPSNAGRWIGEMEEIAATFDSAGVTPHLHLGAAEIFRLLESTPFAQESPETVDRSRTLADTIKVVAEYLPANLESAD